MSDRHIGMRLGRLVIVGDEAPIEGRKTWKVKCDCGTQKAIRDIYLRSTRSCGCIQREKARSRFLTHGMRGTRIYNIWRGMIQRCENSGIPTYAHYGGRGITVCARWHEFEKFFADMGDAPLGKTIERRDNNKGYSPKNCLWATVAEQCRNRRTTRLITWHGETLCIADWAKRLGFEYCTLKRRLNAGWDIERALTTKTIRSNRWHNQTKKGAAAFAVPAIA